jgi:hypothetical protein
MANGELPIFEATEETAVYHHVLKRLRVFIAYLLTGLTAQIVGIFPAQAHSMA